MAQARPGIHAAAAVRALDEREGGSPAPTTIGRLRIFGVIRRCILVRPGRGGFRVPAKQLLGDGKRQGGRALVFDAPAEAQIDVRVVNASGKHVQQDLARV